MARAVPTWDLPWSRSDPGLSRIWALPLSASLTWGPCAKQVISGSQCGCSAPLFLPKGTGMGIFLGFQPPLGRWWVAGSCQTLKVLPGFHSRGADAHLHSLECAAGCLSLPASSGCPAKALC